MSDQKFPDCWYNTTRWSDVRKKIDPTGTIQLSGPTDDRISAMGVLGVTLPLSYCEFTREFGAGQLSGWCEFMSCSRDVSTDWDMFFWNLNHLRFVIESGSRADPRASRMTIFGRFWSGEDYGWDWNEVTRKDDDPLEYAIYSVSRGMDKTIKLADTFPEFIDKFCMGDGLIKYLGIEDGAAPFEHPRDQFIPYK